MPEVHLPKTDVSLTVSVKIRRRHEGPLPAMKKHNDTFLREQKDAAFKSTSEMCQQELRPT